MTIAVLISAVLSVAQARPLAMENGVSRKPALDGQSAQIELGADNLTYLFGLMHFDQLGLQIDGDQGHFSSPPGLRFLGVQDSSFQVPLDALARFSGARVNDLRSNRVEPSLNHDSL